MYKALVTGGSGFIGRHLCEELLINNYEVIVFDHRKPILQDMQVSGFIEGDIRDAKTVEKAIKPCDIVFHLAGLLGTTYLETRVSDAVDVNIGGAVNVYEAARKNNAYVINIGLNPEWLNTYMITKKTAMRLGLMYSQMLNTRIITLEVTHVYGPGQPTGPYQKAIPTFIVKALRNEPIDIFGTGQRIMDCIYVSDVANALRLAAEMPQAQGSVLNLYSGEKISVKDLALKIHELTGSTSQMQYRDMRIGEPDEILPNEDIEVGISARSILAWKPRVSFDVGLRKAIDWYRNVAVNDGKFNK